MMICNQFEDTFECTYFQRIVVGNAEMVLPVGLGCDSNMGAILPNSFIAQDSQGLHQILTGNVARRFHAARTSSRTKCSRMIFGASMVSSK